LLKNLEHIYLLTVKLYQILNLGDKQWAF